MSKFERTKIAIVEDKLLYKSWSELRRVTFDYTSSENRTVRLEWDVFDRGNAVAVLLFDPSRQAVVLVRQFRIPVYLGGDQAFLLEVPAGKIEKDDDAVETLHREVLEETGYRIANPRPLFSVYMSPGAVTEKLHFYAAIVDAECKVALGGGLEDENEDLELVELPLADALAMIDSGEICDAKTIMLLQWAALNLDQLSGNADDV